MQATAKLCASSPVSPGNQDWDVLSLSTPLHWRETLMKSTKRNLRFLCATLLTGILLVHVKATAQSGGPVYDVSTDFSLSVNPHGVWTYGMLSNFAGNLTILPFSRTFGADNGVPIGQWNLSSDMLLLNVSKVLGPGTAVSAGGAFVGPAGTVYFTPGLEGTLQNFAAIRFTVPSGGAGSYQVQTAVQPLFSGTISADADFHVTKNGQEIFGQNLSPNQGTTYTNTVQLNDGDTIDFAIGRGPDGIREAGTGLKIQAIVLQMMNPRPPVCAPVPSGLIGWWKGDGNGVDSVARNNAYAMPNVTFTPGEVGQAFAFDPIAPHW